MICRWLSSALMSVESRSPRMGLFDGFVSFTTRGRSCPGLFSVAATRLKNVNRSEADRGRPGLLEHSAFPLRVSVRDCCRACGVRVLSRIAAAERSLGRPPPQDRMRKNTTKNPIGVTEKQVRSPSHFRRSRLCWNGNINRLACATNLRCPRCFPYLFLWKLKSILL